MSKTFDGMAIDEWGGRFSGAFDLDEEQASRYSVDDVVVLIVRAQVKGANVRTTPQGDVKRVHVLGVEETVIPTPKLWKECMSELRPKQTPLPLTESTPPPPLVDPAVIQVDEIEEELEHVPSFTGTEVPEEPGDVVKFDWTDEQPKRPDVEDLRPKSDPILREYLNQ
jgi:hypothetical protein